MDFSRKLVTIQQISSDSLDCALDNNTKVHIGNQTVPVLEKVICPAPRRVASASYIIENLSGFCCRSKSNLPMHRWHPLGQDAEFEILDMFLSKDDPEDDSDRGNHTGFFCGSPPVRTNNPLIKDVEFGKQALPFASSPLGSSHGGKLSARVERVTSCGVPFGGKPVVRIEGFASGSSESQCIVPALA